MVIILDYARHLRKTTLGSVLDYSAIHVISDRIWNNARRTDFKDLQERSEALKVLASPSTGLCLLPIWASLQLPQGTASCLRELQQLDSMARSKVEKSFGAFLEPIPWALLKSDSQISGNGFSI